jgi:hypothetical protein
MWEEGSEIATRSTGLLDYGAAGIGRSSERSSHGWRSAYRVSVYPTSLRIAAIISASPLLVLIPTEVARHSGMISPAIPI